MAIVTDPNKYVQDIIKTSQDNFTKIAAGTHEKAASDDDYKYNELNQYDIELGAPIILGAPGSKSHINGYNELIIDASGGGNVTVNDISVVDEADETAKLSTNKFYGSTFEKTVDKGECVKIGGIIQKTYRNNVLIVNEAKQHNPHLDNETLPITDEEAKKVDFINRATPGDYYADYDKKTVNNPGSAVVTVKNLDIAVVQALANHKSELIPSMICKAGETIRTDEVGYSQSLKFNEDYLDTSTTSANPLIIQSTGNKSAACKTLGAIRRLYVYDDVAYSSENPMQAMEIDDNTRIAKLALASTTSKKNIKPGDTGADKEMNPYGLVKLRKYAGLKYFEDDSEKEHKGILSIDAANAKDSKGDFDKKHIIDYENYSEDNDIYQRTGRNAGAETETGKHAWTGEERTKVLTSKYVDSLFKYGLGYYIGKPLQDYTLNTTKSTDTLANWKKYLIPESPVETTPSNKEFEKATACKTIGAIHGIVIKERSSTGDAISEDIVNAGIAKDESPITYSDTTNDSKDYTFGRVQLDLAKPGVLETITYSGGTETEKEAARKKAIKDFDTFSKAGLVTTTDFSGLTFGVVDYADYYSNVDTTYKRSQRDGLIAVDIPQVKDVKITKWKGKRSGVEVTGNLKTEEQYYATDETDPDTLKNHIEDRTGYVLKDDEAAPEGWTHIEKKTKVLTTRFVDEIFKYGLGHFNKFGRKDIALSDDVIDIKDADTNRLGTMQILQYGEKHTACKAIGAQREVIIRELAEA